MSHLYQRLMPSGGIKLAVFAAAILCVQSAALAQEPALKREHLGDYKDWSTFKDQPKDTKAVCYMISQPKQPAQLPNGAERRNAFVMISHWPGRQEYGVVRLNSGFDYRRGAAVLLSVDGRTYELYGDGQDAWTFGLDDDARIVQSMKRGLKAEVSAKAARGFDATDVFSLKGFTAAYKRISDACGVELSAS
ncbi:MAG: invasion associated locus B family protein [Pseudomonadota bacterium]